jgi:ribosomal protein S14
MSETCDRCGPAVGAVYRVGELYLCRHCTNQLWPTLSAQGWNIWCR